MTLAVLAGVAGALVAVAAAAWLWRASIRSEPSVRNAYRCFAAAALLWGTGFAAQEAMAASGTSASLTYADLLTLLALPALGAGFFGLARASGEGEREERRGPRARARGAVARLADGCLLSTSLFVIGWVAVFGSEYRRTDESAGAFALQAIHPIADLIALGALLAFAVRARRLGLAPYLALLVVTVGDALAVGARISGARPGLWAVLIQIAGFCLLATASLALTRVSVPTASALTGLPRAETVRARVGWPAPDGLPTATMVAALAAAIAAAMAIGWALGGGSFTEPAVVVCAGVAALALVARITELLRRENAAATISEESEHRFRELAERTSDVVLICDRDAVIRYASPAVGAYGYAPADLAGRSLSELVHPDDRAAGARIVRAACGGRQPGRFPCRVRAADGTWRHIESTVSRYRDTNDVDQLLITARDVSDQVALRRQLTYLTFHDGLTGLPNRAYVEDRASGAIARAAAVEPGRPPVQVGAVFIDLDGFTAVNDSVGHGAGDLLLAQAARRLRAAVPSQDTVARWGGDEFAVLIENAASAPEIVDMADRLASAIASEPFQVADREISLTASVGVAFADAEAPGHLLRNADVAMSRAKVSGGGRVEVFAAHMHADVMRRLEMASDLRAAVTAGRLGLEYQPVVELATSRVIGVEALARWSRDGHPVPPAEFLRVAEDSGLIVSLGDQVLREACAQAAAWRGSGWPIGVSVNFSLRQVTAAGFAASVLTALDESGLPPAALTLEVAERVLIEGAGPMADGLAELRRHGVRLAIDDFGTGYASLAYLRQLAVDVIKIDPSFIAGLGADATLAMLTRTIIQVGHDLGIEVVAEGIERPEHLELLREMGCGLGQGYLIARPMAASGIEALVGDGWPEGGGFGQGTGGGLNPETGGGYGPETGGGYGPETGGGYGPETGGGFGPKTGGGFGPGNGHDRSETGAGGTQGAASGTPLAADLISEPEFAPDPGPPSDAGLDPVEAPAATSAAPAAAPAQ
jgi:diguanylate cyclase (GGDEF)-like protein/PAS domain S-box-containing protein